LFTGKVYLIRDGDASTARQFLEKAVALDPNDERIQFEFGVALFQLDDRKEHDLGRKAFQSAEKLNPLIDRKLIGKIYQHYEHPDWAAEEYQKVLYGGWAYAIQ
jgi:tetratricopeptide (TPR) repeat protein